MAVNASALKTYLQANPSITADDAGVAAVIAAHQVPKPISTAIIMGGLSPASVAKLAANPNLPTVVKSIDSDDRGAVGLWVSAYVDEGLITPDEAAAINALLTGADTSPDFAGLAAADITTAQVSIAHDAGIQSLRVRMANAYNAAVSSVDTANAAGTVPAWSDVVTVFQAQAS